MYIETRNKTISSQKEKEREKMKEILKTYEFFTRIKESGRDRFSILYADSIDARTRIKVHCQGSSFLENNGEFTRDFDTLGLGCSLFKGLNFLGVHWDDLLKFTADIIDNDLEKSSRDTIEIDVFLSALEQKWKAGYPNVDIAATLKEEGRKDYIRSHIINGVSNLEVGDIVYIVDVKELDDGTIVIPPTIKNRVVGFNFKSFQSNEVSEILLITNYKNEIMSYSDEDLIENLVNTVFDYKKEIFFLEEDMLKFLENKIIKQVCESRKI